MKNLESKILELLNSDTYKPQKTSEIVKELTGLQGLSSEYREIAMMLWDLADSDHIEWTPNRRWIMNQ